MKRWKGTGIVVVALVGAPTQAAAQGGRAEEALMRAAVAAEEFHVEHGLEGLTVLVGLGDEVALARDWGTEDTRAADTRTPRSYRVGGLAEALVAEALLRRAERGELDLGTQLSSFFPELATEAQGPTVEQLLTHTSGLPSLVDWARTREASARPADERAALLAWLAEMPPEAPPGDCFAYSETEDLLLGWILEACAGRSVAEELTAVIFAPLGMDDTRYTLEGPAFHAAAETVKELAGQVQVLSNETPSFRAEELCSTAPDLFRWQRGLLAGELLNDASWEHLITPAHNAHGLLAHFGSGVSLTPLDGHDCISAGGGMAGARVRCAYYPDADLTVIVLADGAAAPVDNLERRLARIFLGLPEPGVHDYPVTPELRAACEGTYLIGCNQYSVVFDGRLRLQPAMGRAVELLYQGGLVFVSAADPAVRLTFRIRDGRAVGFDLDEHGMLSIGQRFGGSPEDAPRER